MPQSSGSILLFAAINSTNYGHTIYNVYYHPLSDFPAPKCAAATTLTFLRRLINGGWLEWTTGLRKEYGEVV